jgi:hypothetical protein
VIIHNTDFRFQIRIFNRLKKLIWTTTITSPVPFMGPRAGTEELLSGAWCLDSLLEEFLKSLLSVATRRVDGSKSSWNEIFILDSLQLPVDLTTEGIKVRSNKKLTLTTPRVAYCVF